MLQSPSAATLISWIVIGQVDAVWVVLILSHRTLGTYFIDLNQSLDFNSKEPLNTDTLAACFYCLVASDAFTLDDESHSFPNMKSCSE